MKNFKYTTLYILTLVIISMSLVNIVDAASLYFNPSSINANVDVLVQTDLMLDTEGSVINAVDITLDIPKGLVIKYILYGDSIIPLWIEKPVLDEGKITFSGIIPAGYSGILSASSILEPGKVMSIVFESRDIGTKEISLSNVSILKNDGKGTEIDTSVSSLTYSFVNSDEIPLVVEDNIAPDDFDIEVIETNLFKKGYMLVWNTADKESGIYYYELRIGDGEWEQAESPYEISQRDLSKGVTVKAVDNFGNVTVSSVMYTGLLEENGLRVSPSFGIILILILLVGLYLRRRK